MRLPMDPPAAHPASGLQNRGFGNYPTGIDKLNLRCYSKGEPGDLETNTAQKGGD